MKRIVWMEFASICVAAAAAVASCNWMPEVEESETGTEEGVLKLRFISSSITKGGMNTDDFWLTVKGPEENDLAWSGRFGDRPSEIRLKAGTYTVSALSDTVPMPDFNRPVYGDKVVAAVSGEQETAVELHCKMVNSGLKLTFTDKFKERYVDVTPEIWCASGRLEYPYSKPSDDIAYFDSGSIYFTVEGEYLFSKELIAGEIRHLQVDASSDRGDMGVSITVDETQTVVADTVKIDDAAVLTVSKAQSLPSGLKVTVTGRVVGVISNNKLVDSAAVSSNIAIADPSVLSPTIEDVIPVELSKTSHKETLSYTVSKGHTVTISGTTGTLYKLPALTDITTFTLE